MSNLSLGQKVSCNGYFVKTGDHIIFEDIKDCSKPFHNKDGKELDYEEIVTLQRKKEDSFTGFICGKKKIRCGIFVNYIDSIDVGCGTISERNDIESIYIPTYEIAYISKANQWCKRYVLEDWIVDELREDRGE